MILDGIYLGIIKDNKDPKGLLRCKISIQGLTDKLNDENQLWFSRIMPVMFGGNVNTGLYTAPLIGSKVLCGFLNNDITQGYYFGYLMDGSIKIDQNQNEKQCIYKDPAGNTFITDLDKEGENFGNIAISLSKNSTITIIGSQNVEIQGNNNFIIKGNTTITTEGETTLKSNGNININSESNIAIKASSDIKIEAGSSANIKSSSNMNIESSANVNVKGSTINLN